MHPLWPVLARVGCQDRRAGRVGLPTQHPGPPSFRTHRSVSQASAFGAMMVHGHKVAPASLPQRHLRPPAFSRSLGAGLQAETWSLAEFWEPNDGERVLKAEGAL